MMNKRLAQAQYLLAWTYDFVGHLVTRVAVVNWCLLTYIELVFC